MEQYPKSEVGFQHPSKEKDENCGMCTHFEVLHKNGCERVEGRILKGDYCERFFNRKPRLHSIEVAKEKRRG